MSKSTSNKKNNDNSDNQDANNDANDDANNDANDMLCIDIDNLCQICHQLMPSDHSLFERFLCCGLGMCEKPCLTNAMEKYAQNGAKMVNGFITGEINCLSCSKLRPINYDNKTKVKMLKKWIKKQNKSWARSMLAAHYEKGNGVQQSYTKAAQLYEQAANNGDIFAMYNLGMFYHSGSGVDPSNEKAAKYWKMAADKGDMMSQNNLGNLLLNENGYRDAKDGFTQSYEQAKILFEAAAAQGDAYAMLSLGSMYLNGHGVPTSNKLARTHWKNAEAQGNVDATKNLVYLDEKEGKTINCSRCHVAKSENQKFWRCVCKKTIYCSKKCQKKHWKAKDGHRNRHNAFMKQKKEEQEEKEEQEQRVKDGDTFVLHGIETECPICIEPLYDTDQTFVRFNCCGMGMHGKCFYGVARSQLRNECTNCRRPFIEVGSPEDIEILRAWVAKGKSWAMALMGDRYRLGEGVSGDFQESMKYYQMGADLNHAKSLVNLASFFLIGYGGVQKDPKKALALFERAAQQGLGVAQHNAGLIYLNHDPLRDLKKAKLMIEAAACQGLKDAELILARLYSEGIGTEKSIAEAIKWCTRAARHKEHGVLEPADGAVEFLKKLKATKTQNPNDRCACGSKKKYKKCCGSKKR